MNARPKSKDQPDYGNWVSKKLIYVPGIVSLAFWGLAFLSLWWMLPAALFLCVAVYFGYARFLFSSRGKNIQARIRGLVLDHLDWKGEGQALDIGCGGGALVIELARQHPQAKVCGIDSWGEDWEYSQTVCEQNAQLEGVGERVIFRKGSASELPFDDESLDAVVSNLVFHEVKETPDKRELVREALRVLRKGGKFAFQDLFLFERSYGSPAELVETLRGWGMSRVEFIPTREATFIPHTLKLPFMVGTLGLLAGEK
ncbi:MAG: class I SAM-dependent methyltransferase [Anaerolineales bacterium]|jgi:SAM-dependent methyltransferase